MARLRTSPENKRAARMIDYFALALSHFLLLVALLRLVKRNDVDVEVDPLPAEATPDRPTESRREARERRRRRDA